MQNSTICTIHQASFNVSKMYLGVDSQLNYILGWTFILLVIEQLPVELRDRFTDMREMDLQVQSKFDVQLCCPFLYVQYYVMFNECMNEWMYGASVRASSTGRRETSGSGS